MANEYLDLLQDEAASIRQEREQKSNPYVNLLDTAQQVQNAALRGSLTQTLGVNPNQFAEKKRVADYLGYPTAAVEAQPNLQTQAKIAQLDAQTRSTPVLRQRYTEADFAKLAHDDSGVLGVIERLVRDMGVTAVKGAVGLPQAVVGLANIPSFGYAGKAVEGLGIRFGEAQAMLDRMYSPATQRAKGDVQQAEGFFGTLDAAIDNPSVIATAVGESLPQIVGGAAVARGLLKYGAKPVAQGLAGPALPGALTRVLGERQAALVAGALGEGTMAAGSAAEQIRQQAPTGTLSVRQVAASIATGVGTAGFSLLGGKVAQKLGIADIDTALASGQLTQKTLEKGLVRSLLESGLSEGLLEELPQSAQEQVWMNIATDRPVMQGVSEAAAMGLLAGTAAGSGFQAIQFGMSRLSREAQTAQATYQSLEQLRQFTMASELLKRDPQTFKGLIDQYAQEGPVNELYIDARIYAQAAQDAGLTIEQLPTSVQQQLGEALASGSDLRIPLAEFQTEVAPTDYGQLLLDHVKPRSGAMTRAEAQVFMQTQGDQLKADVERVIVDRAGDSAFKAGIDAVRSQIAEQLNAAGRFTPETSDAQAGLVASFYGVTAAKMGVTPEALFARYPLRVQAQAITGAASQYDQEQQVIELAGRRIPVRLSEFDRRSSYSLALVNTALFDRGFQAAENDFSARNYVGMQGDGGIEGRYERFAEFQKDAPFIEASRVSVDAQGQVRFGDGRHRFAFMRDQGVPQVPVAMDEESFNNALAAGYIPEGQVFNQRGVQPEGKAVPESVDAVANVDAAFEFAGSQSFSTNRDFKVALQQRVRAAAAAAKTNLDEFSKATEEYLVRMGLADGRTALRTNANAVGWYNEKVTKALRLVSLIHPEVATDSQAKFAFVWAMAVTSNGLKVEKNFEMAEQAYAQWKTAGSVMPTTVGIGTAAAAINRGLKLYNDLIAKHGFETVEKFMTTLQKAGDVERFTGLKVSGENLTTMVYGAAALGPKIGNGFFMNLYGRFEQLTMDRWLMRTWGRWTGTLIEDNPAQVKAKRTQLKGLIKSLSAADKKAFEVIIKRKLVMGEIDAVAVAIWKASQKPANRVAMAEIARADDADQARFVEILGDLKKGQARVSFGDELRKAGNALTKYLDGQKEAPSGPPERGNIRKVFSRVLAELKKEYPTLTMSDYQALLWYPEKRLYDSAKTADEAVEGYDDDEAPDYANAAAKLARAKGIPDADIAAAVAAVDAELQADVGAAGVRPGERGLGDRAGDSGAVFGQDGQVLNQSPAANRGQIAFGQDITQTPSVITLLKGADLSTFLHESGHFFLEVTADIATRPDAPQTIRDDMDTLLRWFGVQDIQEWFNLPMEQKRAYHEQFARGFEAYLFEGKAPSVEMQSLFQRFRAWLVNIYKDPKVLNVTLTDEVREVMDRMIATNEQIEIAQQARSMIPLFTSAQSAGMTPEEFADYQALGAQSTADAIEDLQARTLRDMAYVTNARSREVKKLQKQAAARRAEMRIQARSEVMAQPVYRAWAFLTGKAGEAVVPGVTDVENADTTQIVGKLRTGVLKQMYGEGPDAVWRKVSDLGMTSDTRGSHPDILADMFGFESGDDLVRSLAIAEAPSVAIEALTDQRMLENYGELATPEAIERAADIAIYNETRARFVATELAAINKAAGKPKLLVTAAKQFAQQMIGRLQIRNIKPGQYAAAEARAARAAATALRTGDTATSATEKRNQLINAYAAKAAYEAQADVARIRSFFARVTKGGNKTILERGRDPDVVNAARAILAAYGVAPRLEKGATEYLAVLEKNDPGMYGVLRPSIEQALINAKPLEELTIDELRALNDEIGAMWHLAKRSRQMEVDGNLLDLQEVAQALTDRMQEIGVPDQIPGEAGALTRAEEAKRGLQFAGALLRRVEQWSEAKDGRFGGPFLRFVFQPVKAAADRYRADRVQYRSKFVELLKTVAPSMKVGTIQAPELGYTFGRGHNGVGSAELLHAVLHTGNDSNKRKLLLGRGWASERADGTLDTSRWDAFISRMWDEGVLTKAHYDFAQNVWDLLEAMKPLAQKTHRTVFGRYFDEVTANAVETPFGTYRGGYVPAQADPRIVNDAALRKLAEEENESMAFAFPAAAKGFTKGRVEYNRPLILDLRTLTQHIDKVLLFSHMEPAVRDVNKLLMRKGVSQSLSRIDPGAYEGMLIPWLNRAARQQVETPIVGDGRISRMLSVIRNRAGMALMFGNISNTLQQITGLTTAAVKVMPANLRRATAQYIANPQKTSQDVADASIYMRDRMANEITAMNNEMDAILLDPSLLERGQAWTQRHAYFLQAAFDNVLSPIVWTGAYNQALTQGMTDTDAVKFADGVVRQTQGTTLPEDISRIESGPTYARLFTQFIGYFNMLANTNATELMKVADDVGLKKGAGRALAIVFYGLLAPAWIAEAIALAFKGGPEDEDDDGYLDDWLAAVVGLGTLKTLIAGVPFVGQFANAAINRFNDNPVDDRVSLSPAVSLLESAVGAPQSVYKALTDDGSKARAVKDVATAVSLMTGLPVYAVARPLSYLAGLADERIEPTGPLDAARGLVTGTASPESRVP